MSRKVKSKLDWEFDAALGKRIALTRKALGVKAIDLARSAGILQQTLSSYECGNTTCSPLVLRRIANALGVSVAALVPNTTCCGFPDDSRSRVLKSA